MPFFLHPKHLVIIVIKKDLSLLFTLTSAIFAQIGHFEDKNNCSIFVTQFKGSRFEVLNKIGFSFTLSEL